MRRVFAGLVVGAWGPLACGGDSGAPDAAADATLDVGPDVVDAADEDAFVDAPPERAIWVATTTTLFKFDPVTRVMRRVADFDCSGEPMVDLAMNAKEELFGITSESVVRIDKTTGACTEIARGALDLPYATGFVAAASLEAGVEAWLGYKYSSYSAIDPDSGALGFRGTLGNQIGNVEPSGDMVSIAGKSTYLTAFTLDPNSGDVILEIDPNTGIATKLDTATGVSGLLGLGQWAGLVYAFGINGAVYRVQFVGDASVTVVPLAFSYDFGDAGPPEAGPSDAAPDGDAAIDAGGPKPISFRGAAVTTRAPSQ